MCSNLLWIIGLAVFGFGDPDGACCLLNGGCLIATELVCASIGGTAAPSDCQDSDGFGIADVCESHQPRIYWTYDGVFLRSNLDGSDAVELGPDIGSIKGIDERAQRVFWLNSRQELFASNFDGTARILISDDVNEASIDVPRGIAFVDRVSDRSMIDIIHGGITVLGRFGVNDPWVSVPSPRTSSDSDTDGDVDLRDFAAFQNAMTGP